MNYWILLLLLIAFPPALIYADSNTDLEVNVVDANNDSVNTWGLNFVVYQDSDTSPFMTIDQVTNPQVLTLPQDYSYTVEVYRNNMYVDHFRVFLDSDTSHVSRIPDLGGLRYQVLYNDLKPVPNAQVEVFSHTGIKWAGSLTDSRGYSERSWIQPTVDPADEYNAVITLGEGLTYKISHQKVSGGYNEEVVVVPWDSVIDDLIQIKLYRGVNLPLTNSDDKFELEIYDNNNEKIKTVSVSSRGEAHISNLTPGSYYLKVIKLPNNTVVEPVVWAIKQVLMEGGNVKPIPIYGWDNDVQITNDDIELIDDDIDATETTCNCVVFRLDNVEDFYLVDVQKEIIDLFMQKQIPLTLGVVGKNLGSDQELIDYLRNTQSTHSDLIEIGNHGDVLDITSLNGDEQLDLITSSNNQILNALGAKPTVFIPTFGPYNGDTISALKNQNMHYVSSVSSFDLPPYSFDDPTLLRFPGTSSTGYVEPGRAVFGKLANQTMADIGYSLRDYGFAVVLLHPTEYSDRDGWTFNDTLYLPQYFELNMLIDNIQKKGLQIVNISDIEVVQSDLPFKIPQWFKNTALLWSQDKISDDEFFNSLGYLLNKKIILVDIQSDESDFAASHDVVPSWIKTNTALWAENQITETQFREDIIFLIKRGLVTYN